MSPDFPAGNPFRYTGRRYDPETGLYYYRARYYDADLGRFLQVDPIGYADQWNLYAYVGNDPITATDPSGRQTRVVITEVRNTINPFDEDFAAHAAVHVENSGVNPDGSGNGEAVLYDPGGSHEVSPYPGDPSYRPSGDAFYRDEANLSGYIANESQNGAQRVSVLTVQTTPEQEAAIADRMAESGGVSPGACSSACSSVLSGIGPFEDIKAGTFFPDDLMNQVEEIPGVEIEVYDFEERE